LQNKEVYSVKIFFLNPIQILQVVIDTLINLEYESYSIVDTDRDYLLELLPKYDKSIIFFTILNKTEVDLWFKYAESLLKIDSSQVLIGAFAYDSIDNKTAEKFLENNISIIRFSDVQKNPLQVMRQIMMIFEAKGKRAFIRTKTYGQSDVYFYIKNRDNPLICRVVDLSAYALSVEIDVQHKYFFTVGEVFQEAVLILKGVRIRTSLKVLGFSSANNNLYLLKVCHTEIVNNKVVFTDNIPKEVNRKLHDYVRKCLKDEMAESLREIQIEKDPVLKKKIEAEKEKALKTQAKSSPVKTDNANADKTDISEEKGEAS